MRETPFLPATVHDATGVRFDEFPLTPEQVWRWLQGNKVGFDPPPGITSHSPVGFRKLTGLCYDSGS